MCNGWNLVCDACPQANLKGETAGTLATISYSVSCKRGSNGGMCSMSISQSGKQRLDKLGK